MTKDEQLDAFDAELTGLVNRYACECDLGPDLIGVMERVKLEYWLRWQCDRNSRDCSNQEPPKKR